MIWEKSENKVETSFTRDPEAGPPSPSVPAIRTSLARRRLLTKLSLGALAVWGLIYVTRTWGDLAGLPGAERTQGTGNRIGVSKGTGTASGGMASDVNASRPTLSGYTGPDPDQLVYGLPAAIDNPGDLRPSSSLGLEAEYAYQWGPTELVEYKQHLDSFLENHFPTVSQPRLKQDLERYLDAWTPRDNESANSLPVLGGTGISRKIYMTDKDDSRMNSNDVSDWVENKDGWDVIFVDDQAAEKFVDRNLGSSRLKQVWDALPNGIMVSRLVARRFVKDSSRRTQLDPFFLVVLALGHVKVYSPLPERRDLYRSRYQALEISVRMGS